MSKLYKPILIGGAPCAGKSTLAASLASERNIEYVSVDRLRKQFQNEKIDQRHHYPWLFSDHNINAEDFWRNKKPAELITMEIEQAWEYWPTLRQVISGGQYGIVEGVTIMPELVRQDFGDQIKAIFLIDPNHDRVKQTILTQGLWGAANAYADWIKPLELEWVMLHNEWMREQTAKFNYPLIEVVDRSDVLNLANKYLNE